MSDDLALAQALRRLLRPGAAVFVHAGPAESPALRAALAAAPDLAEGVGFTGVFIPGINAFDYAALSPSTHVATNFVGGHARASFEAGRLQALPLHYSDLTRHFATRRLDVAILHCPPDVGGAFSLGLNADFGFAAAEAAARRLFLVHPHLPVTHGHERVARRDGDLVVGVDGPLLAPADEVSDPVADAVAERAAAQVGDGDTVQFGIGRLPFAIVRRLGGRRDMRVHSGIVGDDIAVLRAAGDLAPERIVCGSAWGGPAVHALVADHRVTVAPARLTHDPARIAAIPRFVAINAAIEVDLFGQVNGESVRGRRISGIGGANDFARGARLSRGGRSIIALPANAGRASRIVPTLRPVSVSQAVADADIVVTEQGTAHLRDLDLDARAEALIAIAAPEHRGALADAWRELRATL